MPNNPKSKEPVRLCVTFRRSTAEEIRKIALTRYKSTHDTVIFLANIALKYNYTKDYRYIPCKPQREDIRLRKEPMCIITLLISSSLDNRLSAFMKANFTENKAGTFRSLVETALLYDYDKNLFFRTPQQLSVSSSSSPQNNKSNDIIMLDII